MGDFWPSQPLQKWFFDMGDNFEGPIKSAQGENFERFFFGISQKISKVSKNIFWASCNHVVAQKSIFQKKKSPKTLRTQAPPFSYMRDMSREKWIFVNFVSFLAILRCITFMEDSNLGQNEGILKAF